MSPKSKSASSQDDQPSFEEAVERLETIVDDLESGNLSLEDSIARFEEGTKLSRLLTHKLDEAEKRIERLVETKDQVPRTEPVEIDLAEERAAKPKRGATSEELPF